MESRELCRCLAVMFVCLPLTAGCSSTPTAPPSSAASAASEGATEQSPADLQEATPAGETTSSESSTPEPGAGESPPDPAENLDSLPPMPQLAEVDAASDTDLGTPQDHELEDEETATTDAEEPAESHADSAALLEDSLEAFESSKVFWQQGNFEDAFAALDRAYELMASVPLNGDPFLAQQKEDLRHLISRRVVEIYASRQTAVGDPNGSIPLVINDEVKREIASFQGPERDFFLESYRRSGLYRPMILEELRHAGMPEQLSWLPLVESGFKVRALSRARALGLWQFISSTGYRYGLERDRWVDERMDPLKSTRAALSYLTDLHNLFGDWLTALAAYNCGERTIFRQIRNQTVSYFDQFWDLYGRLPRETRRYVPRFFAVLAILEDPAAYGFELPEPLPFPASQVVQVERPVELERLDRVLSLPEGTLTALNPELRHKATPDEPYALRVPPDHRTTLLAHLDQVPKWEPPKTLVHRVRRGETLSGVAARYGTSVRALMLANRLRRPDRIWPGQQLRIPGRGGASASGSKVLAPGAEITHRVRSGDSLWRLANRYGTTVNRIKRDNGNLLRPGQRLRIRGPGRGAGGGSYTVRPGDTLGAISRAQGVPLDQLLRANGLSRRSTIYPGQVLTIPR
jgi:membrane-bound lytic murein transglycosylase D